MSAIDSARPDGPAPGKAATAPVGCRSGVPPRTKRAFAILLMSGLLSASPLPAQDTVTIRVRDSVTGVPIRRARALLAGRRSARGDTTGLVRLAIVQPGRHDVAVSCLPAGGLRAEPRAWRVVSLRVPAADTVDVRLDGAACDQLARPDHPVVVAGRLIQGYHGGFFMACPASVRALPLPPGHSGDAWLPIDLAPSVVSPRRVGSRPARPAVDTVQGMVGEYLRAWGVLMGPGRFGHRGSAKYQLELDSITAGLEHRPPECPAP